MIDLENDTRRFVVMVKSGKHATMLEALACIVETEISRAVIADLVGNNEMADKLMLDAAVTQAEQQEAKRFDSLQSFLNKKRKKQ